MLLPSTDREIQLALTLKLKHIFKFMINAAPPASNSIYDREQCFKYNNFTQLFSKWQRGLSG